MDADPQSKAYLWGAPGDGLQIGLLISQVAEAAAYPLDLRVAVRNVSSEPLQVRSDISLVVEFDSETEVFSGGPRPSQPWLVAPQGVLEVVGWHFDEPPVPSRKTHRIWAELAAPAATPLRSDVIVVS